MDHDTVNNCSGFKTVKPSIYVICIFIFSSLIGATVYLYINDLANEENIVNDNFNSLSNNLHETFSSNLLLQIDKFNGLAYSFASHGKFRNLNFDIYNIITKEVSNKENLFTTTYNPYILNSERTEFEDLWSQIYNKTVKITYINGTILPDQPFYIPVGLHNFGIPLEGVDSYTSPPRQHIIQKAINNQNSASGLPIPLPMAPLPERKRGIIVQSPGYNINGTLVCFLAYTIYTETFFSTLISLPNSNLDIYIYINNTPAYSTKEFIFNTPINNVRNFNQKIKEFNIPFFDNNLQLLVLTSSNFEDDFKDKSAIIVLVIGLILSFAFLISVVILIYSQNKHYEEKKKLVLEAINSSHEIILGYICHEFRNSINIIKTWLFVAQKNKNPPKNIEIASEACEQLVCVTDDILDIEKLIKGEFKITIKETNIESYLKKIIQNHLININNSVNVKLFINKQIKKIQILTDQIRLKQVLDNALSNSSKFTHQGEIDIYLDLINDELLNFQIMDSGIGIKNINLDIVFQPFTQGIKKTYLPNKTLTNYKNEDSSKTINLRKIMKSHQLNNNDNFELIYQYEGLKDSSYQSNIKGSGLGLPISRMLVRYLGGELFLETDHQRNMTRFQFVIPLHIKTIHQNDSNLDITELNNITTHNDENKTKQNISLFKNIRVLIVDDNINNLISTRLAFEKILGSKTEILEDGDLITDEILFRNDIILLDIHMKRSNGFDVCKEIRSKNFKGIICAFTGYASNNDTQSIEFKKAGFDLVITKPINITKFINWYQSYIDKNT